MPFTPHWMLPMTFLLWTCHFCDSGGVSSFWKILTLEAMESCSPTGQMHQKPSCEVPPLFRLMKRKVDNITEEEEQQAEVSVRPADVDTPVEGDSVEDRILRDCRHAAEWVEANNCSLPKWTCLMFCTWGRRIRLRLLCSMGGSSG